MEREIRLDEIELMGFYGPGDENLREIVRLSPGVKVVARGDVMRVSGDESTLERFASRLDGLLAYFKKYGHVSPEVVRQSFGALVEAVPSVSTDDVIVTGVGGNIVRAKSLNQRKLVASSASHDLMFAVGPAGSGKTYTAIALAVRALRQKQVRRIILTRPAVEAGEKLGFLPGDMKEKLDPYLQPLYDALGDMVPGAQLAKYLEEGTVQIAPLAFMRGRTLDGAFVILDEAQNTTLPQIKMFLTRMGPTARFIVTGDLTQVDLPRESDSGLKKALELLEPVEGIAVVRFDEGDIVRHRLVKEIVKRFKNG